MNIKAENISLIYNDGEISKRKIFEQANLSLNKKDVAIILGPSGTGKSSLLYLLSGLRKATSGRILFNNFELVASKEATKIRYEYFGFVFQQHFLIPYLTVLDNICLSRKDRNLKEAAFELLDKMEMKSLAYKHPYELSGGERQRVAVARALVKKPKIVFADEPTASLDKDTAIQVYGLLKEYAKDSILIVATHDTGILHNDERVFYISNKKIIEQ